MIYDALGDFAKVDLEDIRHFFGADFPLRIRRSEFIDRLGAFIVERPQEWLRHMLERDLRLLKKLVAAGPEVPLNLSYPDFPTVLETVKFLGTDTSDQDFREVWIPKEVYDIVAPHIDAVISEKEADGSFEMERAALGYLNLYGVMTVDEFYEKMLDYCLWARRWRIDVFSRLLSASPVLKLCRFDIGGEPYVCAPGVGDPEDVAARRKDYPDIDGLRPFTPEDALEAGAGSPDFVFGLGTEEGRRLLEMLDNLGYSAEEKVWEAHDIWMNSQMAGDDEAAEAVFSCVTSLQDEIESFEDYNACMEVVAAYANTLPKWLLKGYSPNETKCLKVILQTEEDPLTSFVRQNPLMGLFIHPVPADDPCPCGSGISYRFCHGRVLN